MPGRIWGPTGRIPRVRLHYESGGARPKVGRLGYSGETDITLETSLKFDLCNNSRGLPAPLFFS